MRQRNRDGRERHVGQTVSERVQERGKGDGFEELLVRLLVLHQARGPEERHDQQTHREVHRGDEPRKREVVVDLFVDDVKLDVEPVPQREVAHRLDLRVLREERLEGVAGAGGRAAR